MTMQSNERIAKLETATNERIAQVETAANERIAKLEAQSQEVVEAQKSKSAEKIAFGTLSHEQMAKEVIPRAQRFIESAVTVVGDAQARFEELLEFSQGKYDATPTGLELANLYGLRNSVDSIWSNVVDPGAAEALKAYNNYWAQQLSTLPTEQLNDDKKRAIVAESRRLEAEFRTAAKQALLRLHGMGLSVNQSSP